MDREEILAGLTQELRRGTIVLCVLASLGMPTYGYSLIGALGRRGMAVEANTLYPLLRRLESQGLLGSSWETGGAKPRKYYVITPLGKEVLEELRRHWAGASRAVNEILEEADRHGTEGTD